MTIEEKLKEMIITKYGSIRKFTMEENLSYSNVDSILRRGIKNATWTSVKNLCKALGISANELADEKIVPVSEPSEKKTTDIETMIMLSRQNIQQHDDLSLNDQILDQDEIEVLFDALEIGIEIVKRRRMKKNGNDKNN